MELAVEGLRRLRKQACQLPESSTGSLDWSVQSTPPSSRRSLFPGTQGPGLGVHMSEVALATQAALGLCTGSPLGGSQRVTARGSHTHIPTLPIPSPVDAARVLSKTFLLQSLLRAVYGNKFKIREAKE